MVRAGGRGDRRIGCGLSTVLPTTTPASPQALIATGASTGRQSYVAAGLRSLRWLVALQTAPSGVFRPVGSHSFGDLRQHPRAFDQQPLEATATIAACLAAWRADGDRVWRAHALRAFAWFLGGNDLSISLIDLETGSCCDGLHPGRANENQGAESVVSYLLGLAQIRHMDRRRRAESGVAATTAVAVRTNRSLRLPQRSRPLTQNTFFNRQAFHLRPDSARVVVRPFKPATEPRDYNSTDRTRAKHIVDRVLALDPATVASQLADVLENFRGRHRNLLEIFDARADEMGVVFAAHPSFTQDQRRLVGAYFVHEYSFEAAALFNPSIVSHPDQSGVPSGGRRFILSLRAVGEGHISSLTFRSGVIAADGSVSVDPPARLASIPQLCTPLALDADRAELNSGPRRISASG